MQKKVITLVLLVLCMSIVAAELRVVLTTPQAKFTLLDGESVDYYIGVENKNNFTINVEIVTNELNIVFHNDTNFELQPNETRDVMYTITANETGNYTKTISVTYTGNGESFTLQQQLGFVVNDEQETSTSSSSSSSSSKKTSKQKNVTTVNTAADFDVVATSSNGSYDDGQHDITITSNDDSVDKQRKGKIWSYIVACLFIAVFAVVIIKDIYNTRKHKKEEADKMLIEMKGGN